jgi:hypothetical protein
VADPVVWIVDSSHWPRAYLRAELIERGYDAVGFETLRDAVAALHGARPRRPRAVVVELTHQAADPSLLAAIFRRGIPAVGVAGAVAAADEQVRAAGWARWLRRPLTVGAIADAVEALALRATSARTDGDK